MVCYLAFHGISFLASHFTHSVGESFDSQVISSNYSSVMRMLIMRGVIEINGKPAPSKRLEE